jgi:uncharacterized protein YoxC
VSGEAERGTGVADPERRALVNAQGALEVVRTASESVDERVARIDDRTETQAAEMEAVVGDVSELSATIEEIAASATEATETSQRAAEEAATGRSAAADAMAGMERVRETGEAAAAELERLRSRIGHIEEALAGIDEIAEQTNMLALNASIEAARAGGDSDGVAVVAEEIKSLAEQSQAQSDDIAETLAEVRAATDATVERMDEAVAEIADSADRVAAAAESLAEVAERVDEMASEVAAVSEATDQQAAVSDSVAARCESAADRASAIGEAVADIRADRAEQTAMLREIEAAIDDATPGLAAGRVDTVPTGIDPVDDLAGGLVEGGRAVLRYERADVADLVAGLCGAALSAGYAVSLTPPPGLDRRTLAGALSTAGVDLGDALAGDRLFVLDAFDDWREEYNLFDLGTASLSAVNERTDARRESPLVVVGNVAGEIRVLGEGAAREARYENDAGVFGARDTVLNVVDDGRVDDSFAAFYAGAADQVFEVSGTGQERTVRVRASPTGETGTGRPGPTTHP